MNEAFGTVCRTLFLERNMKAPVILSLLSVLLLFSCTSRQPIRIQGQAQGTYYNIAYYDAQHRNLQPQIDSLLDDFDMTASLWVENSIIRKVNRHQDTLPNALFCDLLRRSLQMEAYTGGAFNCKVGTLVNLYGFGFKNRQDVTDSQIDSLLSLIRQGAALITCDSTSPLALPQGIELDFNAIAQGYAVDLLAHMFDKMGISDYLIDVGGEVVARGHKADGSPWLVGIEKPSADKYDDRTLETAIALDDCSVVTSGNYRKYYEKDGVRYSHTIDPSTGRPVSHSLLSVSVVSAEAWYADAMATAFMVMGLDKSLQFIHDHPEDNDIQATFFIYDDAGEYKTFATPQFQQLIR